MSIKSKKLLKTELISEIDNLEIQPWGEHPDYRIVTNLLNQSLKADNVEHAALVPEMENYYSKLPEFAPTEDAYFALIDGTPVAWVSLQPRIESKGDIIYHHFVALPKASRDLGLRSVLTELVEARAKQRAEDLSSGETVWLEAKFFQSELSAIKQIEARGYEPARYFFFMVRSLEVPIEDHPLPNEFSQRPLKPEDYWSIWQANQDAFSEHWGHAETSELHYQMFMEDPLTNPELWQVAWHDGKVAGMVLNFLDEQENQMFNRRRGYTEEIAVLKRFRRRGLAKALITKSMKMFKQMGMKETALGVDTNNPSGALQLYKALGYETERKSTFYRKQLY